MKKLLFIIIALLSSLALYSQVKVKGYYRKDGTYVQPHVRSSPDKNPYNNYSYPGNYNPYTGETAKGNEDTYLNNYYKEKSTTSYYNKNTSSSRSEIRSGVNIEKFYDKRGNLIFYGQVSDSASNYINYDLLSIEYPSRRIGTMSIVGGEIFVYDLRGKLIRHIKK